MNLQTGTKIGFTLLLAAVLAAGGFTAAQERISKPGQYSGYSPALYDGYKLTSLYIPMRDGTKIAIDVVRPTLNGKVVEGKLPVLWSNSPYNRRPSNGQGGDQYVLAKYGYVIAVSDLRGNSASFGRAIATTNRNEWMPWAYNDAYDITEWLAAQPWADGQVGMLGCSAGGHVQWQAAAVNPPHLKAIFPMSAPSEYYDWNGVTEIKDPKTADAAPKPASGGGMNPAPLKPIVAGANTALAGSVPNAARAAAVDDDKDGALLKAALEEHKGNLDPGYMPFRNSPSKILEEKLGWKDFKYWLEANTFSHFDDINKRPIPAYETANFGEDQRVKLGVMVKLHNVKAPMKLVFAPGNHCNWTTDAKTIDANPFNINTEELRWYDYWFKGVQNGIMDEPPIFYYTYNETKENEWKFAWQWPLPNDQGTKFYFGASDMEAPKGGVNNGTLVTAAPKSAGAKDQYKVDYEVTVDNQNEKGMTYTTPALKADTTLTGHPVIHLWISSTATDGDFVAYLADVAPDGTVKVLPGTDDGRVRASLGRLSHPPYDNLGLPYQRAFAEDVLPLKPGVPTALDFDLAPISWNFKAGHRIRLIITCSAEAHHKFDPRPTPTLNPPPVVSFYRDAAHPSYMTLPVNAPLTAAVKLHMVNHAVVAELAFPPSLDPRYLKDLQTNAILGNGISATSIKLEGQTVVAEFAAAKFKSGETVTIEGQFGGKYYYGEQMRFTGKGVVAK